MAAGNPIISRFHTVSLKEETDYVDGKPGSGKATIRFSVDKKKLKKNDGFTADLNGTTLTVSVTIDNTTYKAELKDMKIQAVQKEKHVKFDGSNMDVTVYKTSQFSIAEKL